MRDTNATIGIEDEEDGETRRENAGRGTSFRLTQNLSYRSLSPMKQSGSTAAVRESLTRQFIITLVVGILILLTSARTRCRSIMDSGPPNHRSGIVSSDSACGSGVPSVEWDDSNA